jgi:hypothetical protein
VELAEEVDAQADTQSPAPTITKAVAARAGRQDRPGSAVGTIDSNRFFMKYLGKGEGQSIPTTLVRASRGRLFLSPHEIRKLSEATRPRLS